VASGHARRRFSSPTRAFNAWAGLHILFFFSKTPRAWRRPQRRNGGRTSSAARMDPIRFGRHEHLHRAPGAPGQARSMRTSFSFVGKRRATTENEPHPSTTAPPALLYYDADVKALGRGNPVRPTFGQSSGGWPPVPDFFSGCWCARAASVAAYLIRRNDSANGRGPMCFLSRGGPLEPFSFFPFFFFLFPSPGGGLLANVRDFGSGVGRHPQNPKSSALPPSTQRLDAPAPKRITFQQEGPSAGPFLPAWCQATPSSCEKLNK